MSDPHQVSIDSLVEISNELSESFFFSNDIYSLLVLALVTVTTYSRKKYKLTSQIRMDLTVAFIPDLILALVKNKTITEDLAKSLVRQCELRRHEIPLILQAYLYAAKGLPTKVDAKEHKKKKSCAGL